MKTIHPLRKWLRDNGHSHVWFATKIGISKSYFSQLLLGKRLPNKAICKKISTLTGRKILPDVIRAGSEAERAATAKRFPGV